MRGLDRKSAIVTGGSSGIGRACVSRLAEAGSAITIADLDEAGGTALAREIEASGGRAQFVRADVADEASVEAAVVAATTRFGRLDAAINAAGIPPSGKTLAEMDAAEWDRNHAINLRGMFFCLKHQIRAMQGGSGGAIVAVASASATMGMLRCAEYCASKAGVTGLVRAAALDHVGDDIRINALLPGATDTPLVRRARGRSADAVAVQTVPVPMMRMAQADEIAAGAIWMISDEASYMTGSCLTIDGGMTIA